jgi:hypothetical protein
MYGKAVAAVSTVGGGRRAQFHLINKPEVLKGKGGGPYQCEKKEREVY